MKRKIVIAVTGASGSIYADLLLKKLQQLKNQSVMEVEGILFVYLYFIIIKLVFNIVVLE